MPPPSAGAQPVVLLAEGDLVVEQVGGDIASRKRPSRLAAIGPCGMVA